MLGLDARQPGLSARVPFSCQRESPPNDDSHRYRSVDTSSASVLCFRSPWDRFLSAEDGVCGWSLHRSIQGWHQRSNRIAVPGGVRVSIFRLRLRQRGVDHLLVEGGPTTAKGFLSEELVDRAVIVRAPVDFARPVPSGINRDTLRR